MEGEKSLKNRMLKAKMIRSILKLNLSFFMILMTWLVIVSKPWTNKTIYFENEKWFDTPSNFYGQNYYFGQN